MRAQALVVVTVVALSAAAAAGCSQGSQPAKSQLDAPRNVPAACAAHPFVAPAAAGFRHKRSSLVTRLGDAAHALGDVLTTDGAAVVVAGKFAYGAVSKDLEDEPVTLYLDTCAGWEQVGEAVTNHDGRVRVPLGRTLGPGVHGVRLVVVGDGSVAAGMVQVAERGARLALFDVDGTLTTGDEEIIADVITGLFEPLLDGRHVAEAYPGGAALTQAEAAKGRIVVYLTGRPYWLTENTRQWLAAQGFAPGIVHLTASNGEALMTEEGVGSYKRRYLQELVAAGFEIHAAYGNASTDISAYRAAGIPAERMHIMGEHAGEQGTHGYHDSWAARAAEVAREP